MSIVTIRAVDRPEVHATTIALLRKSSEHFMSGVLYLGGGRPLSTCYDVDRKLIDHPSVRDAHAAGLITITDRNTGENLPVGAPACPGAPVNVPVKEATVEDALKAVEEESPATKAPRAPRQSKQSKAEAAAEPTAEAPAEPVADQTGE